MTNPNSAQIAPGARLADFIIGNVTSTMDCGELASMNAAHEMLGSLGYRSLETFSLSLRQEDLTHGSLDFSCPQVLL